MKKINRLRAAVCLLAGLSSINAFGQWRVKVPNTVTVTGTPITIPNNDGVMTVAFEELITGSPATVSIPIQGCSPGGTCDTLETNTVVANSIRNPTISKVYDYFVVTPSWTGGTNVTITVNATLSTSRNGSGGGGGGTTTNALTAAASSGAAPGTTFNGSAPISFDYHSFGAMQNAGHAVAAVLACSDSSGSGTVQTCTPSPAFSPATGDFLVYTTTTANAGTSLTINVNASGAKPVAKWLGSTTLAAGDVPANKPVLLVYDGTNYELMTIGNAPSGTTLQTSGGANGSQSALNFIASATNGIGVTLTPTNSIATEKFEASGIVNPFGGGTGVSNPTAHAFAVAEGAGTWNFIGGAALTGQVPTVNNGADPTLNDPGLTNTNVAGTTDTILCDTATTVGHRGTSRLYTSASSVAVTVPDVSGAGCANFYIKVEVQGAGTVTFNRSGANTFETLDGVTDTGSLTSFALTKGQSALIHSQDNAVIWQVEEATGNAATINGGAVPASAKFTGTNSSKQPVQSTGLDLGTILGCADSSGSGSAQVCTTAPSFTPASGSCIWYTTTTANTGTGLTINVNSLGAKSVAKWQSSTTLAANDVRANTRTELCYDGTNWELNTVGNAPAGGGGNAAITILAKTATYAPVAGDFSNGCTEWIEYALTGTGQTATLPSTAPTAGTCVVLKSTAAPYYLQILTGGATTLDGVAFAAAPGYPVAYGQQVSVESDGTNYHLLGGLNVLQQLSANTTGFWAPLILQPNGGLAAQVINAVANTNVVGQFILPYTAKISKVGINVTTGVAATTCDMGIYDNSAAHNLLTHAAFVCTATNQVSTALASTLILPPGTYFIAVCSTATTSAISEVGFQGSAQQVMTATQTGVAGTAANACSAGVLPATLGTVTNSNGINGIPAGFFAN